MLIPLLALLLQAGPNPSAGQIPGLPPELRDRPKRETAAMPDNPAPPLDPRLAECLENVRIAPASAVDDAQDWFDGAQGLDRAHAGQCLGLARSALGQLAQAQAAFLAARDSAPADETAYRVQLGGAAGDAALGAGDGAAALAAFDAAAADAATTAQAGLMARVEIGRARALVALGRPTEAAGALDKARTLAPDNAQAWLLSATLARREGDLAGAQERIVRAAELDPRDPATGVEAGVIAVLAGYEDAARKSWQSVLAMAPGSAEAAQAQAYLDQLDPPAEASGR